MVIEIIILAIIALALVVFFLVDLIKSKVSQSRKKKRDRELKSDEVEDKNGETPCALELKNIVKIYGQGESEVHALKGVSVAFRKNEFVSILGPSGCGKTTMLNIIGGLDRYTSGDLLINGISTKKYVGSDWDTYRNNSIGFVFQSYNLIPHQTVISNVEMALTLSGIDKEERKRRAMVVLEKVGLKGMENKLPNQMSGGQMQRVAIARALVNNPEIILADEPTGALDTETSVQIMDLLKEVAKDRLVIMVTHNPKLAEDYSTRIINLLDGEIKGDTDEFIPETYVKSRDQEKGKAEMKFSTAFKLSLSNLKTKGGRTALTSVAGSIGIIGIALVLALSNGFSGYVNNLQGDTLAVYPLTINESTIDISDFNKIMEDNDLDKFPAVKEIYSKVLFENLTDMIKSNTISDEYLSYVTDFVNDANENIKSRTEKWNYSLEKGYGFDVNDYIYADIDYKLIDEMGQCQNIMPVDSLVKVLESFFESAMKESNFNISPEFVREYIPTMDKLPENQELLKSQYDLIEGEWATEADELMLVMDAKNQVYDITLALLGIKSIEGLDKENLMVNFGKADTFTFDEIMGKEFYYVPNNERYTQNGITFRQKIYKSKTGTKYYPGSVDLPENAMKMKIKGIIRRNPDIKQGVLDPGLAYTTKFVDKILADNMQSEITKIARANGVVSVRNPLLLASMPTFGSFNPDGSFKDEVLRVKDLSVRQVAGIDTPNKLEIYSSTYDAKENMKKYLDDWNVGKDNEVDQNKIVHYSDQTEMMFYALNTMVDSSKVVLIAFTAISLIVSSIMIGIITYVSVVERTKEIGVLRSLGARKKDISRIFNAETFLVGLFAGLIGVGVTYLLSIPINLIMGHIVVGMGTIAKLRIVDAAFLVAISFVLTLVAGIIPSRIAANKDPVEALRAV